MRVEAASNAYQTSDRRRREETRADADERRNRNNERRARHPSAPWIMAPLATQLIGQVIPQTLSPRLVVNAYSQPEARMPIRPRHVKIA